MDSTDSYLRLADDVFKGRVTEAHAQSCFDQLPQLNQNLLIQLAQQAERHAATQPKYGAMIAQIALDVAISKNTDAYVRSLAAFYLARACNHWTQPKRVIEAVTLARRGFEELRETGWVAACDWQLNALAWTKSNFVDTAQALKDALAALERHRFEEFIPECRLSLAYAQILIGEHQSALENIHTSEQDFVSHGDTLNRARCWLNEASSLRRQGQFEDAAQKLEEALSVFVQENAITEQGKAHYQIAVGNMLQANNLSKAIEHFERAIKLFTVTDLDLWRAMAINSLGAVYMIDGHLMQAEDCYQQARVSFVDHDIPGLLADNLNDSGKLNVLMGRPLASIGQLKQSVRINQMLGAELSEAVALSNLGEAYGQLGRYQDALHHLERAAESLETLQVYFRLATCEKYMALIWLRLGQPALAHQYLDKAALHYEMADQNAFLSSVFNYRADTFFRQEKTTNAVQALEQSLTNARTYGIRPQSALALRLLGDALIQSSRQQEALTLLEEAEKDFIEMGMFMEQAACLVSIGGYYKSILNHEQAQNAFSHALQLSEGSFPEIDWQAYVELGNLSAMRGGIDQAIDSYHRGMNAFKQIRGNFLQPALAGSYLHQPAHSFDRIVTTTSRAAANQDALEFIEEAKASTLLRNLINNTPYAGNSGSQELDDLKNEIELLKNGLRVSTEEPRQVVNSIFQAKQKRDQLRNKTKQYDEFKARLERKSLQNMATGAATGTFNLSEFRQTALSALSDNWAALDYYLTDDELITVLVTSSELQLNIQPRSERFEIALAACDKARRNAEATLPSDLQVLGKLLVPISISQYLSSDAYLLIAPHRGLHLIPWSALQPEFTDEPLVRICVPCVVPSLQSLQILWQRAALDHGLDRRSGLIVGLSSFGGLHKDLPLIKDEITALSSKIGSHGQTLQEEDASWKNLVDLKHNNDTSGGLARFTWMHIASHFFSDRHTGRLSGIVLSDGDIFLDQLRDLAPLPGLVSLSACNSNDSFLYEGDERVDLQTTCFIAGANSVVGSSWPILDAAATRLTSLLYDYYLSGSSPAQAAARAQRQCIKAGEDLKNWASFVCAGVP